MIIRDIFCIESFKTFLERQMSKDEPIPFLAIKMWNFYTILMERPVIVFIYGHLFLCSIYYVTSSH